MTQDHDPLDFPGQERTAADNAAEERHQRQRELSDLCKVMQGKEGRRFVWRLLSDAGVYHSTFSRDAMQMAFNEGQRNTGLRYLSELMSACPQHYALMLDEQRKDREIDEQRVNDRRNKPRR